MDMNKQEIRRKKYKINHSKTKKYDELVRAQLTKIKNSCYRTILYYIVIWPMGLLIGSVINEAY